MSDVLTRINDDKRALVASRKAARPLSEVEAAARAANETNPPRGFIRALGAAVEAGRYGLIAEIKKASPSKGLIRADFDPPALARAYRDGGASCLSVLTDEPYFQGKDEYLVAARAAVDLPVLRKDFMVDPYQIVEARALGADCILIIMASLSNAQAAEIEDAALAQGLDVLVEVHDRAELDRALLLKTPLLGVNNRNLKTLEVSVETSYRIAPLIAAARVRVAESGLRHGEDLAALHEVGFGAFLIGERFMTDARPGAGLAQIVADASRAIEARR